VRSRLSQTTPFLSFPLPGILYAAETGFKPVSAISNKPEMTRGLYVPDLKLLIQKFGDWEKRSMHSINSIAS